MIFEMKTSYDRLDLKTEALTVTRQTTQSEHNLRITMLQRSALPPSCGSMRLMNSIATASFVPKLNFAPFIAVALELKRDCVANSKASQKKARSSSVEGGSPMEISCGECAEAKCARLSFTDAKRSLQSTA